MDPRKLSDEARARGMAREMGVSIHDARAFIRERRAAGDPNFPPVVPASPAGKDGG